MLFLYYGFCGLIIKNINYILDTGSIQAIVNKIRKWIILMESRSSENFRKKYLATKFAHFSTIHRKGCSTIKPANVLIHNRVKVTDIQRRKTLSQFNMDISYTCMHWKMFRDSFLPLTMQSGQLYRDGWHVHYLIEANEKIIYKFRNIFYLY